MGERRRLRILFLSHYFPPEVNAPATRVLENAREWARSGHEVHVVTTFPSHPAGRLYPDYRRRWHREEHRDGIRVHRVWTCLAANRGVVRRTLAYGSFLPAALWRSLRLGRFDVVVGTSPHVFTALAAGLTGTLRRTPWVFDLRDLWPESIVAVGALEPSWMVRALERMVAALYRSAAAVVCVSPAFVNRLASSGVESAKLTCVPNGVRLEEWPAGGFRTTDRWRWGVESGQLLVSYVGTLGMAHGLSTVLAAAEGLGRRLPGVRFVLAGDGAERDELEREARRRNLANVCFAGLLGREEARRLVAASDVCLVLLRDRPLFATVLPSKLFEAMAAARPVVLGVSGEARRLVETAGCGVPIAPEDPTALAGAVEALAADPEHRRRLGEAGRDYVRREFDRVRWARRYLELLEGVVEGASGGASSAPASQRPPDRADSNRARSPAD